MHPSFSQEIQILGNAVYKVIQDIKSAVEKGLISIQSRLTTLSKNFSRNEGESMEGYKTRIKNIISFLYWTHRKEWSTPLISKPLVVGGTFIEHSDTLVPITPESVIGTHLQNQTSGKDVHAGLMLLLKVYGVCGEKLFQLLSKKKKT